MFVFFELESLDGFCSVSLMVDYFVCWCVVLCLMFDSMDVMVCNCDWVSELCSRCVWELGVEVFDVVEFELVIVYLWVFELV